jgi:lipoprotein-anchoring transpeptidase ErfK/SrfK
MAQETARNVTHAHHDWIGSPEEMRRGIMSANRYHPVRSASRASGVLVLAAVLGLTACTRGTSSRRGDEPNGPHTGANIVVPKAGATDVPASTEVEFKTENARSAQVELKDAAGRAVDGELRPDGTAWMPHAQLAYGTKYTATVTATGADGKTTTATSAFTTMAKPTNQVRVSSVVGDNTVVGVGMPMIIQLDRDVPDSLRASVQRRMFVKATPPQEGSWHWFNAREVHYRPKVLWQPGTKLDLRILTGGLPLGGGWYGRADLTVVSEVGSALVMTVDNATKQMTVTENGTAIKTIPVSLGRPGMPSSSGTMVVMERLVKTVFDTRTDPNPANRYRVDIEYAQRVTWGGEFIHAAPWSVADQGKRNVSHGCINMSTENAKWLFGKTKIGDPVIVKGTERQLQYGNGWTDWSLTWDEYLKNSALPPAATPPAGTPSPDPTR